MTDEHLLAFDKANPVLVPLSGDSVDVVRFCEGEDRALIVFASTLQRMDDDQITFIVARAVANLVTETVNREAERDALIADWGIQCADPDSRRKRRRDRARRHLAPVATEDNG